MTFSGSIMCLSRMLKSTFEPPNGSVPHAKENMMTPRDHMSAGDPKLTFSLNISGGM